MRSGGTSVMDHQPARRLNSRLDRWLMWCGASGLVLLLLAGTAIGILLRRAEPTIRASLIDTLQKRFHSKVELDDLHVSIVDGFRVEGSGLRIYLPPEARANASPAEVENWRTKPWIVVAKMHFRASWRILPGKPIVISVIHVEGVRVLLPPKADRPHISLSGTENAGSPAEQTATQQPDQPLPDSSANGAFGPGYGLFKLPTIQLGRIECKDALLEIDRTQEPGKPAKVPLDFEFSKLTVTPDGRGGPMAFSVDMVNARPVGNIHSTGHAGPWVPRDPGALPIDGDYKFDHADLSTFKGIAGILSSTGHYAGTLQRIEADGETETPDFRLERVSRSSGEMLTTRFHAIIDGTSGDTWLQPVDAMLGHTHVVAKGQVLRAENSDGQKHGHDIVLDVLIDRGKFEDILTISADRQFLAGNLTMHTSFHLPPGEASIWDKLQLNGQFHLSQARFTSDKIQGRIVELSLRGQGKPKEVNGTDPTTVLSDMQGHFALAGGALQLPDLDYRVPGADIALHGTYGLRGGTLNFEGDAKLDASLSKIVGGWKGLLLIPADPLLHKNGAGTDVPIHVQGTRKDPKFGVDFGRIGKKGEPAK